MKVTNKITERQRTANKYFLYGGYIKEFETEAEARQFAKIRNESYLIARRQERLEKLKQEILNHYPDLDVVIKVVDLFEVQ